MKFPATEKFVRKLIELVEIEREAEISAMREEMRRLSGEQRERLGRAILGLNGKVIGEEFGYKLVKFGRSRKIRTDIAVGDSVIVSYGNPLKSDYVGVVVEKGSRYVVVALESVPKNLRNVRIDLFVSEITFKRMIENLRNLNENGVRALEFALGLRAPEKPEPEEFHSSKLNESQRKAVSLALGSKDFFLIHGPFGTGKTKTLVEFVVEEVRRGNRVLATAESNVAVDNLVERLKGRVELVRLGHPARVSKDLKETTLFSKIERHPKFSEVLKLRRIAEDIIAKRDSYRKPVPQLRRGLSDEEILELAKKRRGARGLSAKVIESMARWIEFNRRAGELLEKAKELEEEIEKELIESAEVVLSTNSTAFLLENDFDVVVVDEATQATIPSVLIPISKSLRLRGS